MSGARWPDSIVVDYPAAVAADVERVAEGRGTAALRGYPQPSRDHQRTGRALGGKGPASR